jgi:ribonuclease HI
MIAETQILTRSFRILYIRVHTAGSFRNGDTAAQTGLLHGLRVCQRRGWHQVHVVGDNDNVARQQSNRAAPKEKTQWSTFWTARCTADAIGVASWGLHPRERNRTSRSIMADDIVPGIEEGRTQHTDWHGEGHRDQNRARAARDIKYLWDRHDKQEVSVFGAARGRKNNISTIVMIFSSANYLLLPFTGAVQYNKTPNYCNKYLFRRQLEQPVGLRIRAPANRAVLAAVSCLDTLVASK